MEYLKSVLSDNKKQLAIVMILILYVSFTKPYIPEPFGHFINNSLFKILFLTYIAYRANYEPMVAIILAITFITLINSTTYGRVKEPFSGLNCKEIELKLEEMFLPLFNHFITSEKIIRNNEKNEDIEMKRAYILIDTFINMINNYSNISCDVNDMKDGFMKDLLDYKNKRSKSLITNYMESKKLIDKYLK